MSAGRYARPDRASWPRRWGLTWVVAAFVLIVWSLALDLYGYHGVSTVVLVAGMLCLGRASYWHGYRRGRRCAQMRTGRHDR